MACEPRRTHQEQLGNVNGRDAHLACAELFATTMTRNKMEEWMDNIFQNILVTFSMQVRTELVLECLNSVLLRLLFM